MHQNERWNEILRQLKRYGFVTVKYLVETLHYSNATVNRDLNALEAQGLVKRSYGGVEMTEATASGTPLPFRYYKMRAEKQELGKLASDLVKDGEVIFIDASTTCESMVKFLTDKKDLMVITNNISVVEFLAEAGIHVVCLGGQVVEPPSMLGGVETVENSTRYHYDKAFFSTAYFSEDGKIASGLTYYLLHKVALNNANEVYYLADHTKTTSRKPHFAKEQYLCDFNRITGVISDYIFPTATLDKYPQTRFITSKK